MPAFRRLAIAGLVVAALVVVGWWRVEGRFLRDFKGWRADEMTAYLGPPEADSRTQAGRRDFEILGWYFFVGRQLIVRVQDGVVVDQQYGSK